MLQNNKKVIIIPNSKNLALFENFKIFALPLKEYSVGFETYFSVEEINKLSKKYEIYVIMNKLMFLEDIENIQKIAFFNIKKIFIEDFSLINLFGKDNIILSPNHLINNKEYVKYLNNINIDSCVVSNDLTFKELLNIAKYTSSELYYTYIGKNNIMYSRRNLISNYNEFFNDKLPLKMVIKEQISKKKLLINEEKDGTVCFFDKIFCASSVYKDLICDYNLIINFSFLNKEEKAAVLKNYKYKKLNSLIDTDEYFLFNKIKYKIGDLK